MAGRREQSQPPPQLRYRGYVLTEEGRRRWTCRHEAYGPEVSVLDSGTEATMTWPCRGRLMRAIDRTFEGPGAS